MADNFVAPLLHSKVFCLGKTTCLSKLICSARVWFLCYLFINFFSSLLFSTVLFRSERGGLSLSRSLYTPSGFLLLAFLFWRFLKADLMAARALLNGQFATGFQYPFQSPLLLPSWMEIEMTAVVLRRPTHLSVHLRLHFISCSKSFGPRLPAALVNRLLLCNSK